MDEELGSGGTDAFNQVYSGFAVFA